MDDLHHLSVKGVVIRDGKILLIKYYEEGIGIHYNLPGGRQRKDETVYHALRRKMMEEAGAEVDVGPFLFAYEFIGKNHGYFDGPKHSVSLVFKCNLRPSSEPSMERCTKPDVVYQTDVTWVPLDEFRTVLFWPSVPDRIIDLYRQTDRNDDRYLGDIL